MSAHHRVLLVACIGDDALMMARLRQQLYTMLAADTSIEALFTPWGDDALLEATANEAIISGNYDSVYRASTRGVFYQQHTSNPYDSNYQDAARQLLAHHNTHSLCYPANSKHAYHSIIARADRAQDLLHEVSRLDAKAQADFIGLRATKNEWIEAGFIAAQLAVHASKNRHLYIFPGKNYQLHDDTELFYAPLNSGVTCWTSDLRCLYLLESMIDFTQANFTKAQLQHLTKLPAVITPLYVHGDGSLTLNCSYAQLHDTMQAGDSLMVQHASQEVTAWQSPSEGLCLACGPAVQVAGHDAAYPLAQICISHGNAWELLGKPQSGDSITVNQVSHVTPHASSPNIAA